MSLLTPARRALLTAPPWSPRRLTGVRLWLRGDSTGAADGVAPAFWPDWSGCGNHVTQTTGAVVKHGIAGGKAVMRLDGAADQFSIASAIGLGTDNWSIYYVGEADNAAAIHAAVYIGDAAANNGYGGHLSSEVTFLYAGVNWYSTGTAVAANGTFQVAGAIRTAGTLRQYINGAAAGADVATNPFAPGAFVTIGNNRAGHFYAGDIAEVVVCNAALGAGERGLLTRYFGSRYGITVS